MCVSLKSIGQQIKILERLKDISNDRTNERTPGISISPAPRFARAGDKKRSGPYWITWVRIRKKKPVISNTGKFFYFNNNVSNWYNNSVVEKIYGMAYIFTLLMFKKPNKTTINKNKKHIFIGQRPFDSRLYLDISRSFKWKETFIFRYFKVFQVKRNVYI